MNNEHASKYVKLTCKKKNGMKVSLYALIVLLLLILSDINNTYLGSQ